MDKDEGKCTKGKWRRAACPVLHVQATSGLVYTVDSGAAAAADGMIQD